MATNRVPFEAFRNVCNPASFPGNGCWESGSIWSLLMLRHKLEPFIELLIEAVKLERLLQDRALMFPGELLDHQERERFLKLLIDGEPSFLAEMSAMELLTGHMQVVSVTDFYNRVESGKCTIEAARDSLDRLIKGVEGDVSERLFLFIPADRASYFNNPAGVFGKDVVTAFPEAEKDMREAGNCYASDLPTAAVFHAMRAAEYGLKKTARTLKVRLRDKNQHCPVEYADWNKIIVGIRGKIDAARRLPAGTKRDKQLQRYSDVADHCEYMKDIWRNALCHARKDFNLPGALGALERIRDFMRFAAEGAKVKIGRN